LIFDVKMDFTRKARFVAGGHMTETPASLTYSSVVSRESVRIAFAIAAVNKLKCLSCDIGNAYLNAECREKIWFVAGPECGDAEGKVCKLVRALYGLKSSGASWRAMFSDFVKKVLKFEPSVIDPDVYLRRSPKADGTGDYYEYLLVYVDDILVFSEKPGAVMELIAQEFTLKDKPREPDIFLGAGVSKFELRGDDYLGLTPGQAGLECWSMESSHYVKNAVQVVKDMLEGEGRGLISRKNRNRHASPLHVEYKPELDVTPECDDEHASRYRQIIGILRWSVEIGRLSVRRTRAKGISRRYTSLYTTWRNSQYGGWYSTPCGSTSHESTSTTRQIGRHFTGTSRKRTRRECQSHWVPRCKHHATLMQIMLEMS